MQMREPVALLALKPTCRNARMIEVHALRLLCPLMAVLAVPASAQWRNSVSRDEMTGKQQAFAHSPMTSPTRPMSLPYTDTQAWLGFGCDGQNEWTYFGFSSQPNLLNTETEEGYSSLSTRVKWDDE